jgi:hypothetical protein
MAKILYGPVVQDARNKLGNAVATKVRAGSMVRKRVAPIQPRTSRQNSQRATLTSFSKQWSSLTDAQRSAWAAFAEANPVRDQFGQLVRLTGHQMFVRLNVALSNAGATALTDPPANLTVTEPTSVAISAQGGATPSLKITSLSPLPASGEKVNIYATAPASPGRQNLNAFYRNIAFAQSVTGTPFDITAQYTAKFGAPVSAKRIAVAVEYINTSNGALSRRVTASAIAT